MIDYRELLLKYIAHIGAEEGITYMNRRRMAAPGRFTEEEKDELQRLNQEQRQRRKP